MNKLLYLVHRIPYPPNKGDKIRSFNFLRALAEKYQIYLGTFIDDPDDQIYVEALQPFCQETCCINLDPRIAKIKSLSGLLSHEALSLPYYRNHALQQWVDRVIQENAIDRVLIFSSPMAQYVQNHAQLHFVADFVDVDSDKWRQYADSKSWPASWIYRREADQLLDYETRIASQAATTVFVSEQEAALFKTLAPRSADRIGFVNNGVDTDFFDPALDYLSPFAKDHLSIVFTGAMDYWANVDAVIWFAQQVMPWIRQQQPNAKFYIVGSKPTRAVQQLAEDDQSIVVTGRVEDVRPFILHASVIVAPLRIARGVQNKVLEAMAMAKPVVVTSAAMEGISGSSDIGVVVEDDPLRFAERVLECLSKPLQGFEQNRRYVQAAFSWQSSGVQLCRLLNGERG